MALFLRILIGLLLAAVGAVMVIKTRVFTDFFGQSTWADSKFGGGGTNLLYKVIGLVVAFIGFMVATNLWEAFLTATVGSFFGVGGSGL